MDFDDFLEGKWLPWRRNKPRHPDPAQIYPLLVERGVCLNKGKINRPWSAVRCECTGWQFEQTWEGESLCTCGCPLRYHGSKK